MFGAFDFERTERLPIGDVLFVRVETVLGYGLNHPLTIDEPNQRSFAVRPDADEVTILGGFKIAPVTHPASVIGWVMLIRYAETVELFPDFPIVDGANEWTAIPKRPHFGAVIQQRYIQGLTEDIQRFRPPLPFRSGRALFRHSHHGTPLLAVLAQAKPDEPEREPAQGALFTVAIFACRKGPVGRYSIRQIDRRPHGQNKIGICPIC
jgi:hypothetical protein